MKSLRIAATAWALCLVTACSSTQSVPPPTTGALLPQSVCLNLREVRAFFASVTYLAKTGVDTTAQGNPSATRSVFYENVDGTKRVTLTVDRYRSSADSDSAYATALQKSKVVPGFKALTVPNLGQRTFAGTVTMQRETHVGIGVLQGDLIIGATLAGFDASPAVVSKLVAMTRKQVALASP